MKKLTSILLIVMFLFSSVSVTVFSASTFSYSPQKCVDYAEKNALIDDGTVCDQFVKNCLTAGGVTVRAGGVKELMDALIDAEYGTAKKLNLSSNGRSININDNPGIKAGDPVFYFCRGCDKFIHTVLIGGFNKDGNMLAYGHNPLWYQIDWYGSFYHITDDGETHKNCADFWVVKMDTTEKNHKHEFKTDLYEDSHPHKMYDKCTDCNIKYYLGWNAKVSSCTDCYKPVSDKPILIAQFNAEDKAIFVSWSPVYNVKNYELYRGTSKNGTFDKITTTENVKISNESVTPGVTYYYKVKAVKNDGSADVWSDTVSCLYPVSDNENYAYPVLSASFNKDKQAICLSWNPVLDANEYEIYRATGVNSQYFKIATTSKLTLTNSSAIPGVTYYYTVKAIKNDGSVSWSSKVACEYPVEDTENYIVPKLTAKFNEKDKNISLSWTPVLDVKEYEIYRASAYDGPYFKLSNTTGLTLTNASVKEGVTYYYYVKAIKNDNTSSLSSKVSCLYPVKDASLYALPKLTVKADTEEKCIYISWSPVLNATVYEVYRANEKNGEYFNISKTSGLSITNKSVQLGKTYYYKVKAIKPDSSVWSEIVSIQYGNSQTTTDKLPEISESFAKTVSFCDNLFLLDGTNVKTLKSVLKGSIFVVSAANKELSADDVLCTGMKIQLKQGNKTVDEKIIVVAFDVDSDGKVTASDARLSLRASVGLEKLSEEKNVAANADAPEENKITASDARLILRTSVGLENKIKWFNNLK